MILGYAWIQSRIFEDIMAFNDAMRASDRPDTGAMKLSDEPSRRARFRHRLRASWTPL